MQVALLSHFSSAYSDMALQKPSQIIKNMSLQNVKNRQTKEISSTSEINYDCFQKNFLIINFADNLASVNQCFFEQRQSFFEKLFLLETYSFFTTSLSDPYYNLLINVATNTAIVLNQWLKTQEIISGVYVIIHKETFIAYIGESINVIQRFKTHKLELAANKHHNYKLQGDYNLYQDIIDLNSLSKELRDPTDLSDLEFGPFFLFILEVNVVTKAERLSQELIYINTWPGKLYNIKSNSRN